MEAEERKPKTRKSEERRKTRQLATRVQEELYVSAMQLAAAARRNPADWLRELVIKEIERKGAISKARLRGIQLTTSVSAEKPSPSSPSGSRETGS